MKLSESARERKVYPYPLAFGTELRSRRERYSSGKGDRNGR